MRFRHSKKQNATTLVEVLIAMGILGFVFAALLSALTFTYKTGHATKRYFLATSLAQSALEEARGVPFSELETQPVPLGTYKVDSNATDAGNVVYTVEATFRGYGMVQAASGNSLTVDASLGQTPMRPNAFRGHEVFLVSGKGAGQIRSIASNTADKLTLSQAWETQPDATTRFRVDGGATVEVTVSWTENRKTRQLRTRALLIPRS